MREGCLRDGGDIEGGEREEMRRTEGSKGGGVKVRRRLRGG